MSTCSSNCPCAGAGQGHFACESKLLNMDERPWNEIQLAGGVWRFQRERIEAGRGGAIHRQPEAPSPEEELRAGIQGIAKETRNPIRSQICVWIDFLVSPPTGLPLFPMPTQTFRSGLTIPRLRRWIFAVITLSPSLPGFITFVIPCQAADWCVTWAPKGRKISPSRKP